MAKVGILMGSDSDLPIMSKAAKLLEEFGIDYEMKVISAHREPDVFVSYAQSAESRGIEVIIAVPIHTKSLGGVDSLYSIVQMPSGIPVATVAINGAANAAILAAKMLAITDTELRRKLVDYKEDLKEQVVAKDEKLNKIGYDAYLEQM